MSFRQNNREPDKVWRKNCRAELLAEGVPDYLVDDERRWNYVLLHGYDHETGWDLDSISKPQAAALLNLISLHFNEQSGLSLFGELARHIKGESPE